MNKRWTEGKIVNVEVKWDDWRREGLGEGIRASR